jgi:hypothetical protein
VVREWDDHPQRVLVLADGFAWDGKTYRSLSKVALAITGCPCRKLHSWRTGANRVMLLPDGPIAQIALWCAHWTFPVQGATGREATRGAR